MPNLIPLSVDSSSNFVFHVQIGEEEIGMKLCYLVTVSVVLCVEHLWDRMYDKLNAPFELRTAYRQFPCSLGTTERITDKAVQ